MKVSAFESRLIDVTSLAALDNVAKIVHRPTRKVIPPEDNRDFPPAKHFRGTIKPDTARIIHQTRVLHPPSSL